MGKFKKSLPGLWQSVIRHRAVKKHIDYAKLALPRRRVFMMFVVGLAFFVTYEQANHWSLFRPEQIVRPDNSLPMLSPKKEIMADAALSCSEKNRDKEIIGEYSISQFMTKDNIQELVKDKPMAAMVDAVAQRDLETAAYLVAIAKKESNLGKFSPKKDGRDCYNYWGFRGSYNQTDSGYSCFDSPEQAVAVVGDRIQYLAQLDKRKTPAQMVIWKCGSSCAGFGSYDVRKWISDVDYYYDKINNF